MTEVTDRTSPPAYAAPSTFTAGQASAQTAAPSTSKAPAQNFELPQQQQKDLATRHYQQRGAEVSSGTQQLQEASAQHSKSAEGAQQKQAQAKKQAQYGATAHSANGSSSVQSGQGSVQHPSQLGQQKGQPAQPTTAANASSENAQSTSGVEALATNTLKAATPGSAQGAAAAAHNIKGLKGSVAASLAPTANAAVAGMATVVPAPAARAQASLAPAPSSELAPQAERLDAPFAAAAKGGSGSSSAGAEDGSANSNAQREQQNQQNSAQGNIAINGLTAVDAGSAQQTVTTAPAAGSTQSETVATILRQVEQLRQSGVNAVRVAIPVEGETVHMNIRMSGSASQATAGNQRVSITFLGSNAQAQYELERAWGQLTNQAQQRDIVLDRPKFETA